MEDELCYDVHFHALTLAHPSFLAFVEALRARKLESLYAQVASPNYLVSSLFLKAGQRLRNMISVMENDVGSVFALVEDDLAGAFAQPGEERPLLRPGELRLGRLRFDGLVICPLVMDFGGAGSQAGPGDSYYSRPAAKPLEAQVRDILEGIRDYRRARPEGFLELRPFIGLDTRRYDPDSLALFLERAFAGYARGRAPSRAAFEAMSGYVEGRTPPCAFAGVKVYPPLGFDPWPEAGPEREKVDYLWSFCERLGLPVVTHCDDQGFRVTGVEEAWRRTSPERWAAALERHPELNLDFAHFGAQYVRLPGRPPSIEWVERITLLARDYPSVYADFSFNGADMAYYEWLSGYIGSLGPGAAERLGDRLLFGSDFLVNLTKLRCYSDYYRIFAESGLPDEAKRRFCSDNPRRFLFGE